MLQYPKGWSCCVICWELACLDNTGERPLVPRIQPLQTFDTTQQVLEDHPQLQAQSFVDVLANVASDWSSSPQPSLHTGTPATAQLQVGDAGSAHGGQLFSQAQLCQLHDVEDASLVLSLDNLSCSFLLHTTILQYIRATAAASIVPQSAMLPSSSLRADTQPLPSVSCGVPFAFCSLNQGAQTMPCTYPVVCIKVKSDSRLPGRLLATTEHTSLF